jgi:peptidoglycan/LPS O-acetylase OafA/YrhL
MLLPTETPTERHANSIGFLRLIFAGLVVYGHSWYLGGFSHEPIEDYILNRAAHPAGIGVRAFFAISGYLVMQSERRMTSMRGFLFNRFLRIYPGLWVCLLVTGLIFPAIFFAPAQHSSANWASSFSYVRSNWFQPRMQVGISGLFSGIPREGDLNGSLWTLPYEIGCYACLALVGWTGATAGRARVAWLSGILLFGLYCFDVLFSSHALFFKNEGRALCAWFVCGCMAALIPESKLRLGLKPLIVALVTSAWLASCHLGGANLFAPVALILIVLWLAWHLPFSGFEKTVGGDYSYGLYIYAYPVQQMLAFMGVIRFGVVVFFFLSLVIALALAVLSWHLVEKPLLRFKVRTAPA